MSKIDLSRLVTASDKLALVQESLGNAVNAERERRLSAGALHELSFNHA